MNISFFELEGWEIDILKDEFKGHNLYLSNKWITDEIIDYIKDVEILSVFIMSKLNPEILEKLYNLKYIITRSTGYDHIDVKYCKNRGILVSNVPEYGSRTVAEWTVGLIINLLRKMYDSIYQTKIEQNFELKNLRGEEVYGKTLGVIGTGKIGKEVIKLAKAFGMNILAYDIYKDTEFASKYDVKFVPIEELLSSSDVITIHCDLNASTYHLINMKNIVKLKKGAYIVNTARGGIVETQALIYALKEGIIKGVALDVFEGEREIKDELELLTSSEIEMDKVKTIWANHVLMKMPNVLVTPHNAFNTKESIRRILNTTIENIKGFINGTPINLVKEVL
ncbi:MAG: hydroxyacid dehydrogenase [bacterium]|nr:hydroxyacid dehydrogenase [bacterium]